jgi:glycosyltransferase involved in cell wall biosynthesis
MLQRWEGTTKPRLKDVWERICRVASPKVLVLHVTSDQEALESALRMPGVETALIPNGLEIPDELSRVKDQNGLRMLYLGRLHPKKGIENLLTAYSMLNGDIGPSSTLTIAGVGDAQYTKTIRAKIEGLGLTHKVKMAGALLGEAKKSLLENSDVVIAPSHTENFGMVVAEALAHGVPVIASKGTPWSRVEEKGCGLWVDNSPESLAAAMKKISHMPLIEMGQRGRDWVKREFASDVVAEKMIGVYQKLLTQ